MTEPPNRIVDKATWRRLIGPALRVIDSLLTNGYGKLDFRLGGGTVLMFRLDHRLSKDIDIFIHDAQALSFLSPRINDTAGQETQSYEEQSNTIKLILPDGDIDFIVAGAIIQGAGGETLALDGRTIMLDPTAEILAKKLLYRADSFKPRDVFDMAAALTLDRPSAIQALRATRPTRQALLRRLTAMQTLPPEILLRDITATAAGRRFAPDMVQVLQKAIADADQ